MPKTIIHKSEDRGRGEYGWLHTRYSFSFAEWFNPNRMGFGVLRVINDDVVDSGAGFPPHSHKDMEIITIVRKGSLVHKDSIGNGATIKEGETQVMSAGFGVTHSEFNASKTDPVELFQIWIETGTKGLPPRYDQKSYTQKKQNEIELLVGPKGEHDLWINQKAWISRLCLEKGKSITYKLHDPNQGVYIFIGGGEVVVAKNELGPRDAIGIAGSPAIECKAITDAEIYLFEIPLTQNLA